MTRRDAGLIALTLALACGHGPSAPSAGTMSVVGGDHQVLGVASAAPLPLQVRLAGADSGAFSGSEVTWSVVSGHGHLGGITALDPSGVGQATFTADTAAGAVVVRARATATGDSVLFHLRVLGGGAVRLVNFTGGGQVGCVGDTLSGALVAQVQDQYGNGSLGQWVRWTLVAGDGLLLTDSSESDSNGLARARLAAGDSVRDSVAASAAGLAGSPVAFGVAIERCFRVLGGGNNVPERYTSDLWLAKGYGYTGTWGFRSQAGNAVKIWHLDGAGAPTLVNTLVVPNAGTISDLQVSPDSSLLVLTGEYNLAGNGLYVYSLADPAAPSLLASWSMAGDQTTSGLHTGTLAEIGGALYDFTARDPASPSLLIFRIQPDSATRIVQVDSILMPANYGIHDTYVRDGMLFVCNWHSGLWIYDIGGAGRGGSVTNPVFISSIVTGAAVNGPAGAGYVHNAWWFHDLVSHEQRYVFVGQEGPASVGSTSSGDIHVVDISDLDHPAEVAHYHMGPQQGTHNFWVDEDRQILYAAYYNGGVVALDVSGTLSGDLASREIARIAPGGPGNTFVWGVMLYGGRLYAADMLSGFWELHTP